MRYFEEILVWQKSKKLAVGIYAQFGESKDFGFASQIERAAVSIMNNIAEGFERKSNNEFIQFLHIAKGSCAELRSMLYLAEEISIIPPDAQEELLAESVEISKMLNAFISYLKKHQSSN